VLNRVDFTDITLRSVFTANCHLAKVVSVKLADRPRLYAVLYNNKTRDDLSVHQDGGRPSTGLPKILETEVITDEFSMPYHNE
jgi:hypothetical protein